MCGVRAEKHKKSYGVDVILGLNGTKDHLATANSVHVIDHLLRRKDGNLLTIALEFEIKERVGGEAGGGINTKYSHSQSKWFAGANQIATRLRLIRLPSVAGDTTRLITSLTLYQMFQTAA